jgi:tRNA dimethylallyltransferase
MRTSGSLPVIALVGPTCTGKTNLSIRLAERLGGSIILCDSRTIYQKMSIGTAKPTLEQQGRVPHFMLDLIEPNRFYSAAEYKDAALKVLRNLPCSAAVPIVCGGTGLYARALLQGIDIPQVPPQVDLRARLNKYADEYGNDALHQKLAVLDINTAKRLSSNDRFRVIRAIEVSTIAGRPFSELAQKSDPIFHTLWIGLFWSDRAKLKEAIKERFDRQMQAGLLEEVQNLFEQPEYEGVLMRAVNYKEFASYLSKKIQLEEARENCITNTFQLSRKQTIWFRGNREINWFAVDEIPLEEICDQVTRLYKAIL